MVSTDLRLIRGVMSDVAESTDEFVTKQQRFSTSSKFKLIVKSTVKSKNLR